MGVCRVSPLATGNVCMGRMALPVGILGGYQLILVEVRFDGAARNLWLMGRKLDEMLINEPVVLCMHSTYTLHYITMKLINCGFLVLAVHSQSKQLTLL